MSKVRVDFCHPDFHGRYRYECYCTSPGDLLHVARMTARQASCDRLWAKQVVGEARHDTRGSEGLGHHVFQKAFSLFLDEIGFNKHPPRPAPRPGSPPRRLRTRYRRETSARPSRSLAYPPMRSGTPWRRPAAARQNAGRHFETNSAKSE